MQKCLVQVPNFSPLHVVRSMEGARFSEVAFTLSLCKLQSVPQGLSTVERHAVRYGRLHCITPLYHMYMYMYISQYLLHGQREKHATICHMAY